MTVDGHSFRFGVQCVSAATRAEWADKARKAEALGYDVLVLPDHVGTQLAPMPAMVAAAEATDELKVGVLVLDNDFRHPLLAAHELATVNLLTGGRLEIGIGAGWQGRDYTALGLEFEQPGIRFAKLAEAVEMIDRYLSGEVFSFSGQHYTVTDARPLKMGSRPPLLIAGGGPRLLRLAAERADIVGIFFTSMPDGSGFDLDEMSPDVFQRKTDRVRKIARDGGRDPELNVLIQHVEITNERGRVAAERAAEYETDPDTLMALPFELIGTVDQIVEDLEERRRRYGISYMTVNESFMETLAPVIERLSGR